MGTGTEQWDGWFNAATFDTNPGPWVKWFAVLPVTDIHGQRHWMRTVYMRQEWVETDSYTNVSATTFEKKWKRVPVYGTIFDVLASDGV